MITVTLTQGEVDTVFDALDQMECEFGLYIKRECDCPDFPHGFSQKHTRRCVDNMSARGAVLLEKFRELATEGA